MDEILSTISIISFVLSGVCLILAILFFVKFKIPAVIGDLSGRTAKKSIARMRESNEKSGAKAFRSSRENENRGKITGIIKESAKLDKAVSQSKEESIETGLLIEQDVPTQSLDETSFLDESGTELLIENQQPIAEPIRRKGKQLIMLEEILLIHTNEIII